MSRPSFYVYFRDRHHLAVRLVEGIGAQLFEMADRWLKGSANGLLWSEKMRRTDAVLDVNTISARALTLGSTVTVERIDGALHDVFLSPEPIRADAYVRLARWLRGYGG